MGECAVILSEWRRGIFFSAGMCRYTLTGTLSCRPENHEGMNNKVMLYVRNRGDISQMNDPSHLPERFLRSLKL